MTSGSSAYRSAGVDYQALDSGKRGALREALKTSELLMAHGGHSLERSRGEPAFVFTCGGLTLGFVVEGLGTKSMIARQAANFVGPTGYANVAYDTVAAIVNDLCCVGALPLVVNAYFATGSSAWYSDGDAHDALLRGWRDACLDAEATWGGGESPTLPGLLSEPDIELAGSAVGLVPDGIDPLLGEQLRPGDEIVLLQSSGLHANGASLARKVAEGLADGYGTRLPSGRGLGEALLDRSVIYVGLVRALLERGVGVHYLSHITGHGLLKLMRPRRELTYRVHRLPEVPEVLTFLCERVEMSPASAYSTLNMGAGFAVYCAAGEGDGVVRLAGEQGLTAVVAGTVEEGPRRVVLEEPGVTYESEQLEFTPQPEAQAP